MMETIFVQLADFGDPECVPSLNDLFARAAQPERICVGLATQQSVPVFQGKLTHFAQMRILTFNPSEGKGYGHALAQAHSLWRGEDYVLQISSHMRFEQGWDDTVIAMLARCPSPRPLLSTCLPAYIAPDTRLGPDIAKASFVMVHSIQANAELNLPGLHGGLLSLEAPLVKPLRSPFAVRSFLFARSDIFTQAPPDPHIHYYGDEIAYSARLWTHGVDIFQPDTIVAYHAWQCENEALWGKPDDPPQKQGLMRVKHLLRLKAAKRSAAIEELDRYGPGKERTLESFWRFAGVNLEKMAIEAHAEKGEFERSFVTASAPQTPITPPRIFVQIASYRDMECQWTVKDLFEKALYPDRISVGICWQYDPEKDKDCFRVETRPQQVRIASFHWKESRGICWARHQAQRLYEGEEYTLIIDSHMRFEFDWDERLIRELAECPSPKAVLSNYPASYRPPHDLETAPKPTVMRAQIWNPGEELRFLGANLDRFPAKPLRGAFVAGGAIFSRGDIIHAVPYDPYLYFNHDEMSFDLRFYTHGWDIYSMKDVLLYHYYTPGRKEGEKIKRPLHWDDHKDWVALRERARKRFDHLLGRTLSDDPEITRDLMKYGLGDVRTLDEYQSFCGIDFRNRVVSEKALRCGFVPDLALYMDKPIHIPEIDGERIPEPAHKGLRSVLSFPDPAISSKQPFNSMLLGNGSLRKLNVDPKAPEGVLVIHEYIERPICDALARYADSQVYTEIDVVDPDRSTAETVVTLKHEGRVTHHVDIDGMAGEVITIFNDIYCNRLAPFYNVNFEWYERPQILRYPPGGKYNQHADADHWVADQKKWIRAQDRDYSVLLYLNDEYEGGELHLIGQNYKIKPRPGMLVAFPSDNSFLHAALPTLSGIRYVIVSWAAIMGSPRVRKQMPYASIFLRQKRS